MIANRFLLLIVLIVIVFVNFALAIPLGSTKSTKSRRDAVSDEVYVLKPHNYNHSLPKSPVYKSSSIKAADYLRSELLTPGFSRSGRYDKQSFSSVMQQVFNIKRIAYEIENSLMTPVSCTACIVGTKILLHYIRTGRTNAEIRNMVKQFCISLKVQSVRVCEGVTSVFANEVIEVLKNVDLGPKEICSFVIGDGCDDTYNPKHEWDVIFSPVKKMSFTSLDVPDPPNRSFFKVLHLSDTHYDPYYMEGSLAGCNEPLCCRLTNGVPSSSAKAAGKWGDYRKCDTPKRTIDHLFDHISSTHKDIDYIIWTGDLPPHDVWNQTKDENLNIIKKTVEQMLDKFPGIPIFPALGNHESVPVNSFPLTSMQNISKNSISWLYDELAKHWSNWLPEATQNTIKHAAYYSVLVRPGFRIISLNMNFCNNKNWWLLINSTDPEMELQWLINKLQSAEFNDEKVHIIGHIPPGHADCLKVWSRNFYKIVNRYEGTITAQFFGHTHYDEFEMFYDEVNQSNFFLVRQSALLECNASCLNTIFFVVVKNEIARAVNIAYIGPSVTPYYDLNPGYRIYYVDGDHSNTTRSVIDHETWVMNLEEANHYDSPVWYKLYSAREAFNMEALRPKDWSLLIDQMTNDLELFEKFYNFYYKASPVAPICDSLCRKRILCDLRSGRSHDRKNLCTSLDGKIDTNVGWTQWLLNKILTLLKSIPRYAMAIPNALIGSRCLYQC